MEEKKHYILEKVGEMYIRYGIRAVTMDDVAAEFGISKKTLYQFFKDKKNLVEQVIDYFLDKSTLDFCSSESSNAIDQILAMRNHVAQILKQFNNTLEFDLKRSYPALYEKVHAIKRKRIYEYTVKNINHGIKGGFFRSELDAEFIAKLQVGRMLYTLNPDNGVFDVSEMASIKLFDQVMDYHMHAICTEKGINYYRKQLNNIQNEENN
ncbi:MAG TPA: TetR/AcrR family transcriptional regulator [Tangfeifania sp.]|nr:TetR/AcrR family transcriptional regulator [Tangfeifania sp.]